MKSLALSFCVSFAFANDSSSPPPLSFSPEELEAVLPLSEPLSLFSQSEKKQKCYLYSSGGEEHPVSCQFADFGTPPPAGHFLDTQLHFHRFNNRVCHVPSSSELYSGHAILAHRGRCSFYDKAANAQSGGATAVIILNDSESSVHAGSTGAERAAPLVTIPVVMVEKSVGEAVKKGWREAVSKGEKPFVQVKLDLEGASDAERYGQQVKEAVAREPDSFATIAILAQWHASRGNSNEFGEALRLYHAASNLLSSCGSEDQQPGTDTIAEDLSNDREAWKRIVDFWLLRLSAGSAESSAEGSAEGSADSSTVEEERSLGSRLASYGLNASEWRREFDSAVVGVEEEIVPKLQAKCATDRRVLGHATAAEWSAAFLECLRHFSGDWSKEWE